MASRALRAIGFMLLLLGGPAAHAQLNIEITRGVSEPVPVAVVPFARASNVPVATDVATVIEHDLASSGLFKGVARTAMSCCASTWSMY
jgi:TolB protein